MARTIADLMAETLLAAGVERIYGVAGDSLNGFTDSLRRMKKIDWVHMRHEEAGAFAVYLELRHRLRQCAQGRFVEHEGRGEADQFDLRFVRDPGCFRLHRAGGEQYPGDERPPDAKQ